MDELSPDPMGLADALAYTTATAPRELTAWQARLYSHVTRLRAGQKGITWTPTNTQRALTGATKLIESARLAREAHQTDWERGYRRAAELLEWLSDLEELQHLPIVLLSAAAYQIAGYPAQALGLLAKAEGTTRDSALLRSFLSADFPALEEGLRTVWGAPAAPGAIADEAGAIYGLLADRMIGEVSAHLVFSAPRCVGEWTIVCALQSHG